MQGDGSATFRVGGDVYDRFMGRYSKKLAVVFAEAAGVRPGMRGLDVGCGPGALTGELVRVLGTERVAAVDPSPTFVAACRERFPGVEVAEGTAEALPFGDGGFDATLSQLVLHFVSEPGAAAAELRRVTRPGGTVAACVWDLREGMRLLRSFWDAAAAVDPAAPDEATTMRFGADGEIGELFAAAGLRDVRTGSLEVAAGYTGFDELWATVESGVGPIGAFLVSLEPERQAALREEMRARVGDPQGPFELSARAWYATATAP